MAAKSNKKAPEKAKKARRMERDPAHEMKVAAQKSAALDELHAITEEHGGYVEETQARRDASHADALAVTSPEPQALTLPLLTDSGTLFIQGVQQLTAQLLGQPESAVMLVKVNGWLDDLGKVKKLIVGDDDKVEGLKAKVISDGEPWGEKGSKQLTLAGALVKVKAVNWRDASAPLTINDLDEKKVEAYLRGNAVDPEKTLAGYMKMTPTWGLKDLSPLQQKNLTAMLADPGEWGQGLRQCLKETRYVMQAPEMEEA